MNIIHGAMCMAISGRCFLSHDVFETSGNRGECYQVCRHEFEVKITSKNTGTDFILGSDYVYLQEIWLPLILLIG
jgi:Collagenase and related proteases